MSDHNFDKVSCLLHMEGANESTTFDDETGKTWTVVGDAEIRTGNYYYGGSSYYGDGTSDGIHTPDHADFEFGSGDFTIEGFAYPGYIPPGGGLYDCWLAKDDVSTTRGWLLILDGDNSAKLNFVFRDGTTPYSVMTSAAPTVNTWMHFAVVRNGADLMMFKNGVLENTTDCSTASINDTAHIMQIGILKNAGAWMASHAGYLDEIRITKGLARYTTDFVVPRGPYSNQKSLGTLGDYSQPVLVRGR